MAQCTGKSKRTGERCGAQAITGSTKCYHHGAGGGRARANAKRRSEMAKIQSACARLGVAVEVDPADALLQAVWEAAGNVAFYRELVQHLPTHPSGEGMFVWDAKL